MLADAYARSGFDALDEIGVPSPHVNTVHTALKRARAKDYRGQLAGACMAHATRTRGTAAMVLCDVTTLRTSDAAGSAPAQTGRTALA